MPAIDLLEHCARARAKARDVDWDTLTQDRRRQLRNDARIDIKAVIAAVEMGGYRMLPPELSRKTAVEVAVACPLIMPTAIAAGAEVALSAEIIQTIYTAMLEQLQKELDNG